MEEWETGFGSSVSWSTVKSGTNLFLVGETANNGISAHGAITSTTTASNRTDAQDGPCTGGSDAEMGATNNDPFDYYTRETKKMTEANASGRAISNWDSLEILPLNKSSNGSPTKVNLPGTTGLRLTILGNAAGPDCAMFRSEAYGTNQSASFSAFTLSADGKNLTLTYTGTLQKASTPQGPWTDVSNAVRPYTVSSEGSLFYRVR
jgi:hypothetical protein